MQDYRKLRVWHLARDLTLNVIEGLPDRVARKVPGLRAQAIRAATSVGANLAEGCSRATRPELLHFAEIALGSLNELDAHLLLARDAGVLAECEYTRLQGHIVHVRRMLLSLLRTIQRRIAEDASARSKAEASP